MSEWNSVRFDPNPIEPLDPEVIPLCDALNAAGFVTVSSCSGHGYRWPSIAFEHSTDARIESMARHVMSVEKDFHPYFTLFQKRILPSGYEWTLQVRPTDVFGDTPPEIMLQKVCDAHDAVTRLVMEWAASEVRHG